MNSGSAAGKACTVTEIKILLHTWTEMKTYWVVREHVVGLSAGKWRVGYFFLFQRGVGGDRRKTPVVTCIIASTVSAPVQHKVHA